jgi:hypothetical protein
MPAVSNLSSIGMGTCSCHKSTRVVVVNWLTAANTVLTAGSPTLNASSVGMCSCGHPASPLVFSATVLAENAGVHRQGDIGSTCSGTYNMLTGAPTVIAG